MKKQLVGVAGVYHVAAELSKMGYIALVTARNTQGIDIVAMNPENNKAVGIQVKTRQGEGDVYFPVITGKIDEVDFKKKIKNLFVFVKIGRESTSYFVVPAKDVIRLCKEDFENYMKEAKHRKPAEDIRKATHPLGVQVSEIKDFENKWDYLGL
jgi:hypothetical protein